MSPQDIQKHIFEQIAQKIKPRKLAPELGEALNMAQGSVYRRINGETLISFEESIKLMQRYDIPLDHLTDPTVVIFRLPSLAVQPKSIYEYLSQTEKNLGVLAQSAECILRYAAVEIPFYYYLPFPHLAAFKFFMWGRTLWHSNRGKYAKFNFEEYTKDASLQMLMKRIVELNCQIQTEEIWNDYMLDITYRQILYCYKAGLIERKEDVEILLADINKLIKHIESVAETGQKTKDKMCAPIQIWDNELFQNAMFILSETVEEKQYYSSIDVPYFMVSSDVNAYEVGFNFFNRIKTFSNEITSANELNRSNFFKRLQQKTAIYEQDLSGEFAK